MPDSDKLIGHLSNLVKEDSKELEEKELMDAELASYPDKSEVTKFEETKSDETKGELVVLKPASGRGQQYTEEETMEVQEKSVTAKEVSKSSTSKEVSREVSDLKAAKNSNRKSISAVRVEDKADKEPTKEKLVTKGLAEEIHEDKEFTRLGTLRKLSRQEIDSNYVRKP